MKPVFRDRDELTAAPDLTAAVEAALATSEHLIVLCTPSSARSAWVGREITLFRACRIGAPVLTALFEGDDTNAFHAALLSGPGGATLHPLAADFRPEGDGQRLALLKLVAALAGVGLDDLIHRDAQRRFRHATMVILGTTLTILLVGAALTVAFMAQAEAQSEQARGIATIRQLVEQRAQVSKVGNLGVLKEYDRTALNFFRDRDLATLPVDAQLLSVTLLHGICEDDDVAGDFAGLKEAASAAWRATDRLLAGDPADAKRIYAHSQSEYWSGLAAWRVADFVDAHRHFVGYAEHAAKLIAIEPGNAGWQKEAGDAASNLATYILHRSADLARAGKLFRSAQERFEAAAFAGYNSEIWRDLADGYAWLGDIARLQNDPALALRYRSAQRRALDMMNAHEPDNANIEVALITYELGVARIFAAQRRWKEAIAGFETGRDRARARALRDRFNADIRRQIRAFDLFEVQTWLAMPPGQRPPQRHIRAVLGDCAAERARPHNVEAATLCTILEAQLLRNEGRRDQARAMIARTEPRVRLPTISERWRIDFNQEIAEFDD